MGGGAARVRRPGREQSLGSESKRAASKWPSLEAGFHDPPVSALPSARCLGGSCRLRTSHVWGTTGCLVGSSAPVRPGSWELLGSSVLPPGRLPRVCVAVCGFSTHFCPRPARLCSSVCVHVIGCAVLRGVVGVGLDQPPLRCRENHLCKWGCCFIPWDQRGTSQTSSFPSERPFILQYLHTLISSFPSERPLKSLQTSADSCLPAPQHTLKDGCRVLDARWLVREGGVIYVWL